MLSAPKRAIMMLRSSCNDPDGTRILIVDDFQEWKLKVRSILKHRSKWQIVGEASDGYEAIDKARDLEPDAILMDIGLPSLNGIEAAIRILQNSPDIKVMFLTQNNDKHVLRAALSAGARGYVLKMRASSELVAAVDAVLKGFCFVSSEIREHLQGHGGYVSQFVRNSIPR